MRVNKKQLKKWIKALDSGEYEQGYGSLNPKDNTYCCLGVACKVLIPKKKQILNHNGKLSGNYPNQQKGALRWLKSIDVDFFNKMGNRLSFLNDKEGFKFGEIATLLELVYIHKAL